MSNELRRSMMIAMGLAPFWLPTAMAQQRGAGDATLEELVVTGIRGEARSVTESTVPIDVLSADDFANQGDTDLSNLLRNVVPSYNVNSQPISDAATIVRPANLRGLAPDHTLVLVNGKRRHRAAVIYWLGNGVSDGAQGPDISAIPSSALKRVEVLRDGASAQYGSDAIAGVMNFILNDANHGANVEARYGTYYAGDGAQYAISGNIGMPLTERGFANFSFEYGEADPTSRSVQRDDAAALIAAGNTAVANPAQIWGSPEVQDDLKTFINVGVNLSDDVELYGHGNYVSKTAIGGFYFRNPNTRSGVFSADDGETLLIGDLTPNDAQTCPTVTITNHVPDPVALGAVIADPNCFSFQEIFPGGFTPKFGGDLRDYAAVAGLRGKAGEGFHWDASVGYGNNRVDFFISNTVNASFGPATPTSFDPGSYIQEELNANFDVSYELNEAITLAGGAEYRDETFEIEAGQVESWDFGPLAAQGFSAASNGFPGFSDAIAGSWSRANYALYGDMSWLVSDPWRLDFAVRWEDFEDFGTTTNGKIATNYRVNDAIAVRGSWNTGFRAPTPGQSNASNVTTQFDTEIQELVNQGTIPPTNPVALLRGGEALEPEKSQSFSIGAILELGSFTLTADYYNIEVDDRLAVSQDFELTPAEVAALVASGVTSAANLQSFRFFTNDFDTETKGVDVVATYDMNLFGGSTSLSLAFNNNQTEVTRFNPDTLNASRIRQLEEGLPETRWSLTGIQAWGPLRALARVSQYDGWYDNDDGVAYDGGNYIVDVEIAYTVRDALTFVAGAQNVFDEYPDENPGAAAGAGNRYSQYTPFGFNGGLWYGRFNYSFE
ncbi:MAG TPA: TonB-dependent receptor [Steroidobacter sp.]|nr:TonB-dependent receptor [Steroidobacter sp.]